MFKEKNMEDAIKWLFGLFEPEDYESYDEEESYRYHSLSLPSVCNALRGSAKTVYQYTAEGPDERSFHYRGAELFTQRACLIYSGNNIGVCDIATTSYDTELWLLEDMSFVIVNCVSIRFGPDDYPYITEYRVIKKVVDNNDDLFFCPEDLEMELDNMCFDEFESKATIYEI